MGRVQTGVYLGGEQLASSTHQDRCHGTPRGWFHCMQDMLLNQTHDDMIVVAIHSRLFLDVNGTTPDLLRLMSACPHFESTYY